MDIQEIFQHAIKQSASDVHLVCNQPPFFRIVGELVPSGLPALSANDLEDLVFGLLSPEQKQTFERERELDFSLFCMEEFQFRANLCVEKGNISASFRITPTRISSLEELGLPKVIEEFALKKKGLIILSGTAGCGKSTTLTYLLDFINRNKKYKIITMEDPIEYIHSPKQSLIIQREVGADTASFAGALKYALRQDPDVVMVGEMRDLESISMTLTTAETGHLVLATIHAADTVETINRIIDVYPPEQQQQIKIQLAENLIAVIGQVLVPRKDGLGRVLATEVLVATMAIKNLIRRGALAEARSQMDSQEDAAMQTLETCLSNMIEEEKIDFETAKAYCRNPARLKMKDANVYEKSIQLDKEIAQQPLTLEEKRNIRVLVIDEDERDRGSMWNMLRRQGYDNVSVAQNGKEGMAKIGSYAPDVIVLDLYCHDVDSFEVCKLIKGQEGGKYKVILITNRLQPADSANAVASGADDFVIKTTNYELLIKAIEKVYRMKSVE